MGGDLWLDKSLYGDRFGEMRRITYRLWRIPCAVTEEKVFHQKLFNLARVKIGQSDPVSKGTNLKNPRLGNESTRLIQKGTHKGNIAGTVTVTEKTIRHRREGTHGLNTH